MWAVARHVNATVRGVLDREAWGSDHDKIVPCIGVELHYFYSDCERAGAVASADRS